MAIVVGTPTAEARNTSTNSLTISNVVMTGGDTIIVVSMDGFETDSMTCSDNSGSNTYVNDLLSSASPNNNYACRIFRATNVTGGTWSITLTFGSATAILQAVAVDVSGLTGTPLDLSKGTNTGTSTTPATGNASAIAQGAELIIAIFADESSSASETITEPSGYTKLLEETNGSAGNFVVGSAYYKITSAVETPNPSWTVGSSNGWVAGIVSYKGSAGDVLMAQCLM